MRVIVEYQGNKYESRDNDEYTAEEASELFYDNFSNMDRFKMDLDSGGCLLIGKIALQSAVILFIP